MTIIGLIAGCIFGLVLYNCIVDWDTNKKIREMIKSLKQKTDNKRIKDDDCMVYIRPKEQEQVFKTVNRLDKNKVDINTRTVTMVNQYARIGYCDDALYNKVYANLLCYPIKIQKEAIEEIREREKEQNKPIKNNYEPITKKKLDAYVSILSDMVEKTKQG